MAAYAIDALAWCRANLGKPYLAGGCRCEVPCPTQDCSGWIVAATRVAGLHIPCINSSGFAIWGREAGTLISEWEAIHTPFALGIRGDNGGENGDGPKGHIVPMVGDGAHTYEEMGKAYGACIGNATGRRFVRWMKVPGLIYGPKPPPVPTNYLERDMIVQTFHYNADGSKRAIPYKDAAGEFVLATISVARDGKSLELDRGASLRNDAAVDADHRKYVPDDLGGATVTAICRWIPQDGSEEGVILRYSDKRRRPVRFS